MKLQTTRNCDSKFSETPDIHIFKMYLIIPYLVKCTIVCIGFYSSSWSTVGLMVHVGEESDIFFPPRCYLGYIQKIILITLYLLICTIVCLGFYSSSWSTVGLMVRVGEESEIFFLPPSIQDILPKWCLGQPDSFSPSASTKWHTFYFLKPPVTGSYCLDRQYQNTRARRRVFRERAQIINHTTTAAHLKRAQPERSFQRRHRHAAPHYSSFRCNINQATLSLYSSATIAEQDLAQQCS